MIHPIHLILALVVAASMPAALAAADDGHGHGAADKVGVVTAGSWQAAVSVSGHIHAGEVVHMDIAIAPAGAKAVRVWIGIVNARGSVRALAEAAKDGAWHAHVEVPKAPPEGSAIWVAVEGADGQSVSGSIPLPPHHH